MEVERKFIDLKDLTLSDEGPGTIEGYRSVFSEIDEGGDIIIKGFFTETIPEYTEAGFTAHSHDWDFDKAVGFPIEAREDDHGFWVKSQFHSTPDAQNIRTKAKERLKAGKKVGFSFGYKVTDSATIQAKDFKDQLPLYVKPERLEANLLKAQKFDRIRILKKGEVIEDSIVTAPMQKFATATAVKSNSDKEEVHIFLHSEPGKSFVEAIVGEETKTIRKCKPEDTQPGKPWCLYSADGSRLLGRHATREDAVAQERAIEVNKDSLKDETVSDSFESFDDVVAALEKQTHNMQRNHDNRVKEGRVLSATNRAKVLAARDALDALLAASEPSQPEKDVDVDALRTQSLRAQSEAMLALIP